MSAKQRVVLAGLFLLMGAALLMFVQLIHFGSITGFFVFEPVEEEFPADFYVVSSTLDSERDILTVDYYPAEYIGQGEVSIRYEIIDETDEVIVTGSETVDLDVNPKDRFLLEIPVPADLPEAYVVALALASSDEEVLKETSFDGESVR